MAKIKKYRELKISAKTFQALAFATLILLSIIIVTGGAVRLSQSGLGCPDWPTCHGTQFIAADRLHPMIEFINRIITILCSILVALAAFSSFFRRPKRKDLIWLSMGLVAGIGAEIVLGGITVLEKLAPPYVMAHMILALIIVWNALVLYRRASTEDVPAQLVVTKEVYWLGKLMFINLAGVIVVGTVVTGSGPHSGSTISPRLHFPLKDVAILHSDFVIALVALTLGSLFLLSQSGAPEFVQRSARNLLWIEAGQAIIGYTQYFTKLPALLVGFHIAGATLVWLAMIWFNLQMTYRPSIEDASDTKVGLIQNAGLDEQLDHHLEGTP